MGLSLLPLMRTELSTCTPTLCCAVFLDRPTSVVCANNSDLMVLRDHLQHISEG